MLSVSKGGIVMNKCAICNVVERSIPKYEEYYHLDPGRRLIEHHISYLPCIKILVCQGCHNKIHQGIGFENLKPPKIQKDIFYSRKGYFNYKPFTKARKLSPLQFEMRKQMKILDKLTKPIEIEDIKR
jgi:hypothetical protein